jgi:hypothetical protein
VKGMSPRNCITVRAGTRSYFKKEVKLVSISWEF